MSQSLTDKQRYWSEQLDNAERAGLSLAEYARQNSIPPQKLYQWRSSLKKKVTTSVTTETQFTEVVPTLPLGPLLTVHLPAAQLSFEQLPDPQWLSTVLQSVSSPA